MSALNNLDIDHQLKHARKIHESDLRFHLVVNHGVSVQDVKTKGELGKLHLLAHTILAHPELREMLNLGPGWGYPG